jgi:hypothetical protein
MADPLLMDWDDRLPWKRTAGSITSTEVLRGSEETSLAVILGSSPSRPSKSDLRDMFRARSSGGVTPVLLAITYLSGSEQRVTVLGLDHDAVPVDELEPGLVEQLLKDALEVRSPSGLHAEVSRRLGSLYGGVASGLRNEGLFASHVLEQQPTSPAWRTLCETGQRHIGSRGASLLDSLGYVIENVPDGTVLREATGGHRRAAAVLLAEGESFDNPLSRLHNINAVTHGLALARRENLDWLVVLGGPVIRLYPVSPDVGVGRKGQTQTFVELDMSLLSAKEAGFLPLLFSPGALASGGDLARLLDDSSKYALGLSARLRDRIYVDVVPALAVAVANRMGVGRMPADEQKAGLDAAYHQTMIILFRLLFVAYGEDRGLLPYGKSDRYTRNALKTLALDMAGDPGQDFSAAATTLWDDLTQVWKVIDTGDIEGWGVPPYNGGLFTRDAGKNPSGAATYGLDLTNGQLGPALRGLLVDKTPDGVTGPVDFRSLSVREFGTIYEGLLESGLGIAETDLALDQNDTYVPAAPGADPEVHAGEVYFHSRSGSRKATGSYFTKPFAVEHLLDTALEPALDRHLQQVGSLLASGATKTAAEALFDFRVADLSMGSAHFLVAAVDRIEARFSAFLAEHPLPEVAVELHALRAKAASRLGLDPGDAGIDDGVLLRRQIARRCIYGVDINEIAVELARLAVWIHTFVPGLPLSFLNHGLVHGNSLTGVGRLSEITGALRDAELRELRKKDAAQTTGLEHVLDEFVDRARESLAALGGLADASVADVAQAGTLQVQLERELAPLGALCDIITAERMTRHLGNETVLVEGFNSRGKTLVKQTRPHPDRVLISANPDLFTATDSDALENAILTHPHLRRARKLAGSVSATHFPVQFPEVFRRNGSGFDCLLGNPPWEKLKVEEHAWWALRAPGVRAMTQQDRIAKIAELVEHRPDLVAEYLSDVVSVKAAANVLAAGPFPGLRNATDTDLFAAFCWRFWHELRDGGHVGIVLPRTALAGGGTEEWRKIILAEGNFAEITLLTNAARWAFDMEPRYTIGLVTIRKGGADRSVKLRGPFASPREYDLGMNDANAAAEVTAEKVLNWSDAAIFPLIPSKDVPVFAVLKAHPSLADDLGPWKFQPIRELHTTDNKSFFDFDVTGSSKTHTLPVLAGASFNLWQPDFGTPYAYAEPATIESYLHARRGKSAGSKGSAWSGLAAEGLTDPGTLPMHHARIAFRDVTRATDSRTMICALVPPEVTLVHLAPYLLQQRGTAADTAYLLGVLSSIPLDWYARRFVEQHMTYEHLNAFPIPRVDAETGYLLGLTDHHPHSGVDLRPLRDRIAQLAGRLAAVDGRYKPWAHDVGVKAATVTSASERSEMLAELDALVSILYGLSEDLVGQLFGSFHRGWDHKERLVSVLEQQRAWTARLMTGA